MFDTYNTKASVVDASTSTWKDDCYNAIISSNYNDPKTKKLFFLGNFLMKI